MSGADNAWTAVDSYIVAKLIGDDPALDAALADSAAAGLPDIAVSAAQGKLLHLMARMAGARRVLEIGTLGGYSTIWLARALPEDGRLLSLEYEALHAEVARRNVARAGLSGRVEVRVGRALDLLPAIDEAPFDFVFIDADKESTAEYARWAVRLARPGAVIAIDNVVRSGRIVTADSGDARVNGVRAGFDAVAAEPRLSATAIQTVGAKGWDGLLVAIVGAAPNG